MMGFLHGVKIGHRFLFYCFSCDTHPPTSMAWLLSFAKAAKKKVALSIFIKPIKLSNHNNNTLRKSGQGEGGGGGELHLLRMSQNKINQISLANTKQEQQITCSMNLDEVASLASLASLATINTKQKQRIKCDIELDPITNLQM
jgi:hypothetical protein